MKDKNQYSAVLIESSLVDYSLKFLLLLQVHSESELNSEALLAKTEGLSKEIIEENFSRNIDRAAKMGLISKRLGVALHRFRESRNAVIQGIFLRHINKKRKRVYFERA